MYKQQEIESELITTKTTLSEDDFVAIAVKIDENGLAVHSGLLIKYRNDASFFHFDSQDVLLKEVDLNKADRVFHKELTIIDKKLIPAFINHCKIIKHTAKPTYGYFYSGSYYENGDYHSDTELPQLMSCVGFCINVITGFLEEKKYIEFSDWKSISPKAEAYFNKFIADFVKTFPEADIEDLKRDFRRIKPSELLSSAYFNSLPIRKIQTDSIKDLLESRLVTFV